MLLELGLALVSFTLIASGLFYLYLTWHFDYWVKRGIPGPQPKPLFGTFPGTITHKRNFIYDLDEVYSEFKGRHRFVGVFMTRNPQLLILDPLLAKEILIKNFKCFQDNESSKWMDRQMEPISGNNPFVLPAADWKEKRAEIVPGLTLSKVKGMYPIIANNCRKLGNYLAKEVEQGTRCFDAKEFSLRYTSEVVADVVWGIEAGSFNSADPKDCTFLRMSKRMISQTFYAFTYFFLLGIFPWIRRIFSVRFFPPSTDSYFLQLAQVAGNMRRTMSANQAAKRQDFLQHLLDLRERKGLTDIAVVAHMLTFHFDGFETSATLISHCLLLLARHPEAQQKLRLEIEAQENLMEDFDGLMKLPYLEQCINETLRIFTPLPFMSKICTESCWLEQGDGSRLQLNKGDVCLISLHSFHHDERYFEQPETFKPERFNAAAGSSDDVKEEAAVNDDGDGGLASADGTKRFKDLGVYMPFGDGPRICLGMKFGLAQSKAAIVEIIKNFELTVNERTRSDNWQAASGFITGLDGGIYLNLQPIK